MEAAQDIHEHAQKLADDGFVVVDDFLDPETCDDLYEEIKRQAEDGSYDVIEGRQDYAELVNWDGAVVNKRTGRDEGMWDIFNVDEVIPEVRSVKNDETILEIIDRAVGESYSPETLNVYWNRAVTQTRDFHADTYSGKFKSFVYLTDVPDESYGPFTYIPGSHETSMPRRKASELVNRIRGTPDTDAVFFDRSDAMYCTAPKGALIISNQAGYHRGQPQAEDRERMLLSTSYTPTAK